MATTVALPKYGMTMEQATIVEWYKSEGEWIEKGEPLLQVETDKLTIDVEAPASGILGEILTPPGTVVLVHQPLASLLDEGQEAGEIGVGPRDVSEGKPEPRPEPSEKAAAKSEVRILASPVARRMAREADIDLSKISGSGPRGQISKGDIEAYLTRSEEKPAVPEGVEVIPLSGMRKTIADRMASSVREIPHIALTMEVDMIRAEEVRLQQTEAAASTSGQRLSVTSLLAKVVAVTLRRHPRLNATLHGEEIWLLPKINLGVAVAVDEGLIVPVVHDADQQSLQELDRLISELSQRARSGELTLDQVTDGTFTITNLGMYGVDEFEAIINPPQAAILAFGRIVRRPVAVADQVQIRPTMRMTLSADHRLLDGAVAAQFLEDIRRSLEYPYLLI